MLKYRVLFMILWLATSCEQPNEKFFKLSKQDIQMTSLMMDTIWIDLEEQQISDACFWDSFKDTLLLVNPQTRKVYTFSSEGSLYGSYLGAGESPRELAANPQSYFFYKNNHYFFDGWTAHIYDLSWQRVDRKTIDWSADASLEELQKKANPEWRNLYEMKYFKNNFLPIKDKLIFHVETSHPKLNPWMHADFYTDTYIYAVLDVKSFEVERLIGHYPEVYQEYAYIPTFASYSTDLYKSNMIITCFELDPLMYILDINGNIIEAFGVEGKSMNTQYRATHSLEEFEQYVFQERSTKGFYDKIKYYEDINVVFRTYTQGIDEQTGKSLNRMQIYKNKVLIGDVESNDRYNFFAEDTNFIYIDLLLDEVENKWAIGRLAKNAF